MNETGSEPKASAARQSPRAPLGQGAGRRRSGLPTTPEGERSAIRLILVLVAAGWLSAVALLAFAAIFWDRM